jgi:hypothetical protein
VKPVILVGPPNFDSAIGFSTQSWQSLVKVELNYRERMVVKEIGFTGDGTTVFRIRGLGASWTIQPDLPISFPVEGEISGAGAVIEISARSDGSTTVYPMAYISGGLA